LDPMPAATLRRISMKALARYQVILLGEQRHIRCEQLAQGCCPNSAAVGVEPAASRSRVQCSNHYTTEPPQKVLDSGSTIQCQCCYSLDIKLFLYTFASFV